MSYTDYVDAPPARGVPERVICRDASLLGALVAELNRDLAATGWHAWPSDEHRIWASQVTGGEGAVAGKPGLFSGCGQAVDEDNPSAMRRRMVAMGVLKPGPEWLTTAEVADLFGASVSSVTTWARKGKFGDGGTVRDGRCMRYRAAAVHAMREMAGAA